MMILRTVSNLERPSLYHLGDGFATTPREELMGFRNFENYRMIWPLSHGTLDPEAVPLTFDAHAARTCDGIDCAREFFAGEQVVLVSLMSACCYGIDYTRRHPNKVKQLVLIGACYRPINDNRASGRFRSGFLRLSSRHRTLAGLQLRYVGQRVRDPARLKGFLENLYADGAADLSVLAT